MMTERGVVEGLDLSLGTAFRTGDGETSALAVAPAAVAFPRRIDETCIKVRVQWAYLYDAVGKLGNMIDFCFLAKRNIKAAKQFLDKALNGLKDWEQPGVLNTYKTPTYGAAIAEPRGNARQRRGAGR